MIWKRPYNLQALNDIGNDCLIAHLGIEITEIGDDYIIATLPVDHRTKQPFGLLHGGASVVLAETLGSLAGYLCTQAQERVVGIEVNANHLRSARSGKVTGKCKPIHLGHIQQVWSIDIYDENDQLCCTSRLTTAILR